MERLTERYKDPIANTVLIKECGDKLCKNIDVYKRQVMGHENGACYFQ